MVSLNAIAFDRARRVLFIDGALEEFLQKCAECDKQNRADPLINIMLDSWSFESATKMAISNPFSKQFFYFFRRVLVWLFFLCHGKHPA